MKKMDKSPDDLKAQQLFRELSDLDYEVSILLDQAQNLGEEGQVEDAIHLLKSVDTLHSRKAVAEVILSMKSFLISIERIEIIGCWSECFYCSEITCLFSLCSFSIYF